MTKVTIVSTVEQVPGIDGDVPTWRSWKALDWFSQRGYRVEFLMSRWNHYTKRWRYLSDGSVKNVRLLVSLPYTRNVSILRAVNYALQAVHITMRLICTRPDVVLITVPAIEHLLAGLLYKKIIKNNAIFLIDFRDLWPEVIVSELLPRNRFLAKAAEAYYGSIRNAAVKSADAVLTISPLFSEKMQEIYPAATSKIFWAPHPKDPVRRQDLIERGSRAPITFVYCGTISSRTKVAEFCSQLISELGDTRYEITIAGFGDQVETVESLSDLYEHVQFLGRIPYSEVEGLYLRADYGILPYPPLEDFDLSFPNKYLEYMSFGLRCVAMPLSSLSSGRVPKKLEPVLLSEVSEQFSPLERSEREGRISCFEDTLSSKRFSSLLSNLDSKTHKAE